VGHRRGDGGLAEGADDPARSAFVAANERAHAAHEHADLRTRYWDWTFRNGEAHYQKYGGTPPQHLLFGLRKALDMLFEEGLDAAIRRHALLAEATRHAVSRWAEADALAFNIVRAEERANSVTTVLVQGRAFRIAHMGHVNAPMVFGVLGAIEMALGALGIPHGRGGLQAAVEYLGREVRP
jgi:alanine-glyoxylate transaminase/serine-glyoxylate transaminase/serine-pyruvate transaminase